MYGNVPIYSILACGKFGLGTRLIVYIYGNVHSNLYTCYGNENQPYKCTIVKAQHLI